MVSDYFWTTFAADVAREGAWKFGSQKARQGAWKFGSKMAREPGRFGAQIASKTAPNIACNLGGGFAAEGRGPGSLDPKWHGGEPGSLDPKWQGSLEGLEPKLPAKEPPILCAILVGLLLELWHSVWQPR